jgi:hypothetical protein
MPDFDTILSDASQLPLEARIYLIDALWETIPEDAASSGRISEGHFA